MYNDEMGKVVIEDADKPEAPCATQSTAVVDFDMLSDPVWIAEKEGLKIGNRYKNIDFTDKNGKAYLFELVTVNGSEVVFKEIGNSPDVEPIVKKLEFKNIMTFCKRFKLYTGDLRTVIEHQETFRVSAQTDSVAVDRAMLKLKALALKHVDAEKWITFYKNPNEIRANTNVAKGALTLVPMTFFKNLNTDLQNKKNPVCAKWNDEMVAISQPSFGKLIKDTPDDAPSSIDTMMVGYWWISTSSDAGCINMKMVTIREDVAEIVCMTNTRMLKPGELLCIKKPECSGSVAAKKQRTA